ncbi:MAG: winged helix-turn-helix domain-containing protein [Deltaproteobacteria bacterium]|nr:winged helix-turn-helix domain-containing protein [Deltaproteobacteria bacterium]
MRPHGSPMQLEQRRFAALSLLKAGFLPGEIAQRIGVDRRSVRRWKATYYEKGKPALKAIPAPGRPSKLPENKKQKLEHILLKGAKQYGYPTDLWTCPRIVVVISRIFHVDYHPAHLGRLLHAMGWSPQKPERRAQERNERAIARWIKTDWEGIKKKPKN